ncbi:MAG: TRAP transporter small permease [Mariniphaga sp.]|nr:TRAP transporter small permease [Mariniphaga sp.]
MRKKIDNVLEYILIALMSILVLDVLWQVFSRYILGAPSSFTDELAGYLLIWVGLLGSAYVAGKNEHLAIDLLLQKMTGAKKKRLQLFINMIVAVFALSVMFIGGTWLVYTRFHLEVSSAALGLPLGYVYLVLPLSGALIIYYAIDNSLSQ